MLLGVSSPLRVLPQPEQSFARTCGRQCGAPLHRGSPAASSASTLHGGWHIGSVVAGAGSLLLARYQTRERRRSARCTNIARYVDFPFPFGKSTSGDDSSEAAKWFSEFPRRGEVLIGWVRHPTYTGNTMIDVEVEYVDGNGGVMRSRAKGFEGAFKSSIDEPRRLILQSGELQLSGSVVASGMISGSVKHNDDRGGSFRLQALPACYNVWYDRVKSKLGGDGIPSPMGVFMAKQAQESDGGSSSSSSSSKGEEKSGSEEDDATEFQIVSGPQDFLNMIMGRGGSGGGSSSEGSKKRRKEQRMANVRDFSMKPKEVKDYLDRFVMKQTNAKEMLAVAICDHYNRARQEIRAGGKSAKPSVSSTTGGNDAKAAARAEKELTVEEKIAKDAAGVAKEFAEASATVTSSDKLSEADVAKEFAEAAAAVESGGEITSSTNATESLSDEDSSKLIFIDTDEDVIELKPKGDRIDEYVNGKLAIKDMEKFEVDVESRKYTDDTGQGIFKEDEDLEAIVRKRDVLFTKDVKKDKDQERQTNYTKPNILLLGPTGSGKTYLLKNLADLIGVPFVKADATKFTETGYVGRDAEDVMRDLMTAADGDKDLAQVGIVYVDEIDKVCAESGGGSSSFRRGTQSTFLKLMEDTELTIQDGPPQLRMSGMGGSTKLSTRHVLFVFSGAFSQLDKRLQEEDKATKGGFGFAPEGRSADQQGSEMQSLLHKAGTEELVKAGLEPEFVGRIPVRVALGTLSEDDLYLILANAEEGPVAQLTDDFDRYGISIKFTEDSLRAVARAARKEGTGARALVTILEGALRRFKFHMPSLVPHGLTSFDVTEATITESEKELDRILALYPDASPKKDGVDQPAVDVDSEIADANTASATVK